MYQTLCSKPKIKSLLLNYSTFPLAPSLNGHNSTTILLSVTALSMVSSKHIMLQNNSCQMIRCFYSLSHFKYFQQPYEICFILLFYGLSKEGSNLLSKFSKNHSAKYSLQHSKMFSPNPLFFPLGHCHSCVDLINIHGDNNQN